MAPRPAVLASLVVPLAVVGVLCWITGKVERRAFPHTLLEAAQSRDALRQGLGAVLELNASLDGAECADRGAQMARIRQMGELAVRLDAFAPFKVALARADDASHPERVSAELSAQQLTLRTPHCGSDSADLMYTVVERLLAPMATSGSLPGSPPLLPSLRAPALLFHVHLASGDPADTQVRWGDPEAALGALFADLLPALSKLYDVRFHTSTAHFLTLSASRPVRRVRGDRATGGADGAVWTLGEEDLASFRAANDWDDAAPGRGSAEHEVHVLLYAPPSGQRPLLFRARRASSAVAASAASPERPLVDWALLPGWGLVLVANDLGQGPPSAAPHAGSEGAPLRLDAAAAASLRAPLGAAVRSLLGLPPCAWSAGPALQLQLPAAPKFRAVDGEAVVDEDSSRPAMQLEVAPAADMCQGLAQWELRALQRARIRHLLDDATRSAAALATLLRDTPGMPFLREERDQIRAALQAVLRVHDELDAPPSLLSPRWDTVCATARRAATLAAEAFFSPRLVPQLYFPEEYLYAIYSPLLVPLLSPLWVTLRDMRGIAK